MIEALAEAILSKEWGWDSVRRDVFQLLAWGYADAEKKIRQEYLEVEITWLLSEAIDNRLMYGSLPAQFILYNVKEEAHVKNLGNLGNGRKRVDIVIEHTGNRPYKKYIMEAKRCDRNYKGGISWYSEGIKSFIRRDYAREAPEAMVVGIVQTDTPDYWREALKTYSHGEQSLMCESQPANVNMIADLPGMVVSTHRRDDASLIDIYHVFLDCKRL